MFARLQDGVVADHINKAQLFHLLAEIFFNHDAVSQRAATLLVLQPMSFHLTDYNGSLMGRSSSEPPTERVELLVLRYYSTYISLYPPEN